LGELSAELTQLKQTELLRLYDFNSKMLQQAPADLRRAYINFFERRAKFPKFKKKAAKSFRIPQRVRIENGWVYAPSIGPVRFRQPQTIESPTKSRRLQARRRSTAPLAVNKPAAPASATAAVTPVA
jgi:putative transposase